jgi:hypothetical protein
MQEAPPLARDSCSSDLCGVLRAPAGVTDLTADGEIDWVHFGSATRKLRESGLGSWKIGALENAMAAIQAPASDAVSSPVFAWTDGDGATRQTKESNLVGLSSTAVDGFVFTVSQTDATSNRGIRGRQSELLKLKLFVGVHKGSATLSVTYSHNGESVSFADDSLNGFIAPSGTSTAVYELTFPAVHGGELHVNWTSQPRQSPGEQRVILQAATLSEASYIA